MVSIELKAYDVPAYGSCFYEAISALLNQGLTIVQRTFNPSFLRKLIVASIVQNLNDVQSRIIDFSRLYQMNNGSGVNASTAFSFVNEELRKNPHLTDKEIVENYIRSVSRSSCYVSELDVSILNEFLMKEYNIYIFAFTIKPLGSPQTFDNNHPIVKQMKHVVNSPEYEHVQKFAAVITDEVHYNYLMFVTHHQISNTTLMYTHLPIIAKRILKHALDNLDRPIKLVFEKGEPQPFLLQTKPYNSKNTHKTRNLTSHPVQVTYENAQDSPSPKKNNMNNNAKLARQLRNDEEREQQKKQNAMIAKIQQEENNADYARKLHQIEKNAQLAETLSREGSPSNSRLALSQQRNNTKNNALLARRFSNAYARGQNSPAVFPR